MTSKPRVLSCGLLITSPQGWLMAHATRTTRWDLPKGKLDPGETPMQAALRECLEETGLDLHAYADRLQDLGAHRYLPAKDLHLFRLDLAQALDLSQCCCSTFVERPDGQRYHETDAWAWVPPAEVPARAGKSLVAYLVARGVLAPAKPPGGRPAKMGS